MRRSCCISLGIWGYCQGGVESGWRRLFAEGKGRCVRFQRLRQEIYDQIVGSLPSATLRLAAKGEGACVLEQGALTAGRCGAVPRDEVDRSCFPRALGGTAGGLDGSSGGRVAKASSRRRHVFEPKDEVSDLDCVMVVGWTG